MDMSLGANTTMEEETEMDTEIDFPFDINDFEVIDEVGEVDYFKNDSSDSIDLCDDKEYSENVLQLDKALACEHIHSGETLAKNKDKSLCYNTLVHMKSDQTTPLKQNVPVLSGNSNKETPAFVKEENYISTSIVSKKETLQPASRDLKNKTPISQSNTLKTETAQPFSRDSKNATLIPANGASNKKRQPASRDSKNETPITASEVLMEANTIRLDINLSKELCNLSSTVSSKKIVTDVHGSIKGVCSPHVVTDEKTPHLKKGHMLEEKTFADSSAGKKISPTTGKITKKESKVEKRNEINTKNRGLNKRKREMEENKSLPKKQKQDEDENAVGLQWQKTLPEKRGYFMTCIDKLTTAVRDNYREYLDNYREYRHWFEKNRRLCPIVDTHLPEQKILCQKCILRAGVEKNTGLLILGVRRKMFFVSKPDRLYYAPPVRKVIKACQELVKTVGKPVFDAVKRKGFWQSLLIRCNEAGDVLVQVDLHAANQKDADTIFKEMNYVLIEFFSTGSGKDCNVKSLYLKIVFKNLQCIFGSHSIEETVGGMKVKIYPHTYFNTSTGAMNMMLEVLTAVAKREGTTEVLEIGCGTGIIGQILSKCSNKVYGIDTEFAVEDARENAELNGVKNSRYFGGNTIVGLYHLATSLSKASNTLGIINSTSAEVISSMKVLKHVCQENGIKKLVYVSVFSNRCYNNLLELFMPNNIKPTCSFLPYYIIPIDFGLHCYSAIVVMKRVENNFLDDLYNLPKIISLKDTPSSQFSDQSRECLGTPKHFKSHRSHSSERIGTMSGQHGKYSRKRPHSRDKIRKLSVQDLKRTIVTTAKDQCQKLNRTVIHRNKESLSVQKPKRSVWIREDRLVTSVVEDADGKLTDTKLGYDDDLHDLKSRLHRIPNLESEYPPGVESFENTIKLKDDDIRTFPQVQILPHQHSQTADTTFFESNKITYDRDNNSLYEEKKISSNDRFVRDGFKDKVLYSGLSNKEFPHRDNISPVNLDLRKVLEDNMKDHYNSPTIDQNIKSNLADYPYSYSAKTKESTAVTEKIKQDINTVLGSKSQLQMSRVSNKDKEKLIHVLKTNATENVDVKVTDTIIKQSSTQESVAQLHISEVGDVRTSNIQPTISSFSQSESPLKIKDKSMYSFPEDAHINKIHIYSSDVGENKSVRDECTLDDRIYQRYSGNNVASTELNNSATKSVHAGIDTHDRNLDYNNEGIRIGSRDTTFQNKETSSQYIRINLAEVVISDTGGNVRNKKDYFTNFRRNYNSHDSACPKTVNSLNFKTTPTDIDLYISRPNIPGVDIYEDTVNDVCSVRRYDRPDLNDFDTKDARMNRDFIAASNLLDQNGSQENKFRRDLGLSNWESQNRLNMLNYDHGANKVGRSFNAENEKEYMKSIDVGYNNQSIASRKEVTSRSFSTVPNLTTMGNKSSSKDFKPVNSSVRLWSTHPHNQINKLNANKFDIKDSTPHSNTETQHYDLPTQIPTVQGNRINKHEEERAKKANFEVPLVKTRTVNFTSLRNVLDDKTKIPLRSQISKEVWSFGHHLWGVSGNLGMGTQARLPDSAMGLFTNTAELTRNDRYFSDLDGKINAANQCYEDFQSRMNYSALSSEESKYRSSTTNVNPLNKSDSHEDVKLEWPEEKARGVDSVSDVFWNTQRPSLNRTDHRAKTLYNPSGFASNKYWQDKTLSHQGAVSEAFMPLSRRPGEVNTSTDHAVVCTFSSQHLLPPKEPPPFSKKSIHSLSHVRPSFVRTTNVQLDALGKPDQFQRSLHQYSDVHLSPQTMKPNQEEPYWGDSSVSYYSGLLSRDVPARTLPQQPGFGTLFGQPSSLYPHNNSAGVGLVSRSGSDTASWVPWTASTGPMYR